MYTLFSDHFETFLTLISLTLLGSPAPAGSKCGGANTITYEIKNRLPDKNGLHYPPRDQVYMTCSKTANSNADLTVLYEKKVLFPTAGVTDIDNFEHRIGALCGDFKGHSAAECKSFNLGTEERKKMLRWEVMKGGITPVGQPLDKVVNRVFKGFLKDLYDLWLLTAPVNEKTGAPVPPSRQQCANWVVEAWDKVSEELCAKAWTACGYKTKQQLASENETVLAPYTKEQVNKMVAEVVGANAYITMQDLALVDPDPFFPEDEDDCDE